jgi:hypothetical protein
MNQPFNNLVGNKYSRLTVVQLHHKNDNSIYYWKCRCDCGKEVIVPVTNLNNGHTKSCGCLLKDLLTKHGKSKTRLYGIWQLMIQRCENNKNDNYRYYGAKGISVCAEWHDPHVFIKWAEKNGYFNHLTIDRINNLEGYNSSNCRWVTMKEQLLNKRPRGKNIYPRRKRERN